MECRCVDVYNVQSMNVVHNVCVVSVCADVCLYVYDAQSMNVVCSTHLNAESQSTSVWLHSAHPRVQECGVSVCVCMCKMYSPWVLCVVLSSTESPRVQRCGHAKLIRESRSVEYQATTHLPLAPFHRAKALEGTSTRSYLEVQEVQWCSRPGGPAYHM